MLADVHEDALKTRRRQQLAAELPPPPVSIEGFVPASSFDGTRAGMVFKLDVAGLGYYVDQPLDRRYDTLDATLERFVPAASFQGARSGMVFKTGPAGLGYYADERPLPAGDDGSKK